MNVIRLFFFCFLLEGLSAPVQAQFGRDEITIHSDKAFYVSGELIWYKVYLPVAFQGQELALRMALLRPNGESVEGYFVKTGGATALDGYFKLPYDLPSDMYHLLVLGTHRESKKRVKLGEAFIPVYNDLSGAEKDQKAVAGTSGVNPAGDLQVSIRLDTGPFQKGTDIRAQVSITDRAGNPVAADLSVSVTDAGLTGAGSTPAPTLQTATTGEVYRAADLEEKLYYQGYLTDEHDQPRRNIPFAIYSIPEQKCFFSESDENGAFALTLPDFAGSKAIQFVDLQNDSLEVQLDRGIELARAPQLVYTEAVKNYMEWSRNRKLIYQLYNTVEAKLEVEEHPVTPRIYEPDHRLIFKQYASFPDLYTFFLEVSTPLKFRINKDGGYYSLMFNPDPRMRAFYQGAPIFIVDGKITRDVNFLEQLDIAKLDTIDQFFDFAKLNSNFGKLGNSGVAILKTSIPNLQLPAADEARIVRINGLLAKGHLAALEKTNPQQPDFRPQLYWSADQRTDGQGRLQLSFPQSDDLGTFRVEIVARGRDGTMGYGQQKYEVQW